MVVLTCVNRRNPQAGDDMVLEQTEELVIVLVNRILVKILVVYFSLFVTVQIIV